ncbi:uncharacterized protein LOC108111744 [Drosophila eugracilis]|uniref:uncharacterized protein LOC108111744 n=1 Tax=Drosophila eugracilis TaxID=29029 RepID=UPI001BDB2A77|nr:uncharacterized protein LOC108111744 [Drosophila eugracilis]
MPIDQVFISYLRNSNWINVLLLRSMNLFRPVLVGSPKELLEVTPNGIVWIENNLEYRIMLNEYFDITTKTEDGLIPFSHAEILGNNLAFGLGLRRIRHPALNHHTIEVEQTDLPLNINTYTVCSMHCCNCANEIIEPRQYHQIQEIPRTTMKPQNYFCARNRVPVYPMDDELYYGLNYLVISTEILGNGIKTMRGRRRIMCSLCKQFVGEFLGRDVAVQLYADALRLVTEDKPVNFKDIFGHVTATQILLRLLHDADPNGPEKSRLFLKAIRPDGQLQYLHLHIDTNQVHILRSELDTSEDLKPVEELAIEADTSSDSDFEIILSDSSTSSSNSTKSKVADVETAEPTVQYIHLRGFRGYRLRYIFSENDQELNQNYEITRTWFDEGSRILRISYLMMSELITELKANEHVAAFLEKTLPPQKSEHPRLSYILFEPDEDFYARHEQIANPGN